MSSITQQQQYAQITAIVLSPAIQARIDLLLVHQDVLPVTPSIDKASLIQCCINHKFTDDEITTLLRNLQPQGQWVAQEKKTVDAQPIWIICEKSNDVVSYTLSRLLALLRQQ